MKTTNYEIGGKVFVLDSEKAQRTLAAKKLLVIDQKEELRDHSLLPIKYEAPWAIYNRMKRNHWVPEEVNLTVDNLHWCDETLAEADRWAVLMGVGFFSAAEGNVGFNVMSIKERLAPPEWQIALTQHAFEENVHTDSLLYMIASLGINPYEAHSIFNDIPEVNDKLAWGAQAYHELTDHRLTTTREDIYKLMENVFIYGQCIEGMGFFSLFAMMLNLGKRNLFPGITKIFEYTLRDETNHIELFRTLLLELRDDGHSWGYEFEGKLRNHMADAVRLEIAFIQAALPESVPGLSKEELIRYAKYLADHRLKQCEIPTLFPDEEKAPLEWMAGAIELKKEQNFFEGRPTEYQKGGLRTSSDDEL